MPTKSAKQEEEKKGRVKVDKLQANKEKVKDLTDKDAKHVKGGLLRRRLVDGSLE